MLNPCPPTPRSSWTSCPTPRRREHEGLKPAIAIEQKGLAAPRSTVGTHESRLPAPALRAASAFRIAQVGKVLRAYTCRNRRRILGRGEGPRLAALTHRPSSQE